MGQCNALSVSQMFANGLLEFNNGCVAIRRFHCHRMIGDVQQRVLETGIDVDILHRIGHAFAYGLALVRSLANDDLKQDTAKDIDVAGFPNLREFVLGHFGCHIDWRATHAERFSGVHIDGETPVHHKHFTERAEHDVFGFQVAVDDVAIMSKCNGIADLHEDLDILLAGFVQNGVFPRRSIDHLHRIEQSSVVVGAHFMNRNNVRMIQIACDLSFIKELAAAFL